MDIRHSTPKWLLSAGLLLGLAATSPAAITTIADTFSLNGTTRTAGVSLGGLTTEIGGATWVAVENSFSLTAAGAVTSSSSDSWTAPQASVALPAATGVVTLTVGANLYNSYGDTSQWCGVGFLGSATSGWWTNGAPELWVYLKEDGNYSFCCNGWTSLASGDLGVTTAAIISIAYNPATNSAKLTINGTDLSGWVSLGAYTPTLGAASIKVQAAPTGVSQMFDNFVVTVPEPASLGLLLAAGGLLAGRRRHRR